MSHLAWSWAKGEEEEVTSEAPGSHPPSCSGWGRAVFVFLLSQEAQDESRLNGEPRAVLARPTLTHLSSPSPVPSPQGQMPGPSWQGIPDAPGGLGVLPV